MLAGAWSARIDTGAHLLAAALLMLAGADHDRIARWVEVGVNGRRHRGIASEGAARAAGVTAGEGRHGGTVLASGASVGLRRSE